MGNDTLFATARGAVVLVCAFLVLSLGRLAVAQSQNAEITGRITDARGAVVPGARVTARSEATGVQRTASSNGAGYFLIGLLTSGRYDVSVQMRGFQSISRTGIQLAVNQIASVNFVLKLGRQTQTITVQSNASPLNTTNATLQGTVPTQVLDKLPLIVSGNMRSAASLVVLMPGVSTGGSGNPFDARINGGQEMSSEAVLDGASMQEGLMSQSGMVSMDNDYPISPDAVSEVHVLTSNYAPQYGSTTGGVITAVTRSGTDQFHGSLYEYAHNTAFNARQFGVSYRPKDIENDFGGTIGGPVKLPWFDSPRHKLYFFLNVERWTIRGGTEFPVLSIPSVQERNGDFSDWKDSSGNLIPIYNPATTRSNPSYNASLPVGPDNEPVLRDAFPDNIIPQSIMQSSLANQWFKFLPTPTASGPLNNYVSPVPISDLSGSGVDHRQNWDARLDEYIGTRDHISVELHHHNTVFADVTNLPRPISYDIFLLPDGGEIGPWVNRLNWDHTFSASVMNNLNYGYLDFRGSELAVDQSYADQLPKIPGVADHNAPPQLNFSDGFVQMGLEDHHHESRPTNVVNDLLTWVHGKHVFKFGGDYRALPNDQLNLLNGSGIFSFASTETGLPGINSGSPIASFILGQVDNGAATFTTVPKFYSRGKYWALFGGDTFRVTPKLTVDYGVRWDVGTPAIEKFNQESFFDPLAPNPGADGRLGALAFPGTKDLLTGQSYGSAGFGRRSPEQTWYGGVAPRVGLAYRVRKSTVVRAGYGIFYEQAYYPGWSGGTSLDGFNSTPSFSSSNGGLTPAFLLSQGLPQTFQQPPIISASFDNGEAGPLYRPFNANRRPYAQNWNLTIEHQFTNNFYFDAGYVGSKGTRLLSQELPLNALNPKDLASGQELYDQFQPGQTELDSVAVPYSGWVEQMQACAPDVAQALQPYPQYCGPLFGLNENAGNSTYHSFQLKIEHRLSEGLWLLTSYTVEKEITDTDSVQTTSLGGIQGVISPFQRERNKSLSIDDVPQVLSVAATYALPIGQGRRFLNNAGIVEKVFGGWQLSSVFRASSGVPFAFRSSECNVPSQFAVGCIPGIVPGGKPFLHNPGSYNPSEGPLFNAAAFENPANFNFSFGQGPRVSNLRGPGYTDQDLSLIKNVRLKESLQLQFRAEAFNVWNWHSLTCAERCSGAVGFNTDVASPSFGMWNGSVTTPRNIQLVARLTF